MNTIFCVVEDVVVCAESRLYVEMLLLIGDRVCCFLLCLYGFYNVDMVDCPGSGPRLLLLRLDEVPHHEGDAGEHGVEEGDPERGQAALLHGLVLSVRFLLTGECPRTELAGHAAVLILTRLLHIILARPITARLVTVPTNHRPPLHRLQPAQVPDEMRDGISL